jgi:hypothetical protein
MASPSPKLILLAFRFFGWLFPPPTLDKKIIPSPDVLKEKGKWWNWASGALFFSLLLACAILFCFISYRLAGKHLAALGEPLFLIRAEPFELCVWAVFLALVVTPWLSFLILRIVLGKTRYEEFLMVVCHSSPMGGAEGVKVHFGKMFCLLFFLLGPLLAGLIVLRIDTYTAFTNDAMVVSPFWTVGKEEIQPYRHVRGVYAVSSWHAHFHDVEKPRHALVFADGTVWTTADCMRAPRPETDRLFIQHVAERSGCPIRPIRFLEDIQK